ncbi:MAG TPA: bifunctional folylpolyglutamate synthase/dihydrofolate synthase, partial [Alphaproteobacteria bacterium]|nr:bifunctional folylpolyglutamate synthase/dihydrofolate synthase [Alphaproteobacteria bacterium]
MSALTAPVSDVILDRLKGLHPKVIDLSLGRIESLLAKLGHPHTHLPPVIHVAGTNGKGSTCAFLRAMLEAAGRRVHVYTSPHLVRFHERIRVGGTLISEDHLAALLAECEEANGQDPITFFEITTAAAFLAFARTPADALVLEVGLGGRLDATNVVQRPALSIITPVDLDHQDFLGPTITAIAAEKAGILKAGTPAIIGPQNDEAREEIEDRATAIGAPLSIWGQDFMAHEEHGRMVYQDEHGLLDLPLPRLPGSYQIANAAQAIAALRVLDWMRVPDEAIEHGLQRVEWPARMQRITRGPLMRLLVPNAELWLDGGHNPHAGRAVAQALADLEERSPKPLFLICGMLKTKDMRGYFDAFAGLARHVATITIPDEPNAVGAGALYDAARA